MKPVAMYGAFVDSERKPMFVKMSQIINVAQVKLKAENV
jgi:hypothetical protein